MEDNEKGLFESQVEQFDQYIVNNSINEFKNSFSACFVNYNQFSNIFLTAIKYNRMELVDFLIQEALEHNKGFNVHEIVLSSKEPLNVFKKMHNCSDLFIDTIKAIKYLIENSDFESVIELTNILLNDPTLKANISNNIKTSKTYLSEIVCLYCINNIQNEDELKKIFKIFPLPMQTSLSMDLILARRSDTFVDAFQRFPQSARYKLMLQATFKGDVDLIVKSLPYIDVKVNNSEILYTAVKNNNVKAVSALLDVSDPCAKQSRALLHAALNGFSDIVDILLPVSDADFVYKQITETLHNENGCSYFLEQYEICQYKKKLLSEIEKEKEGKQNTVGRFDNKKRKI